MSGSSVDGLDIVYAQFLETSGKWQYYLEAATCYPYPDALATQLRHIPTLDALSYKRLDVALGKFIAERILEFIDAHELHYRVDLIGSHGHTGFHRPEEGFSDQLGNGAVIAALTGLPVVSELRMMDVALGGQGAPLVPAGEKWLFAEYGWLLNLGGIANLTCQMGNRPVAFDICATNQILNRLAELRQQPFDRDGWLAAQGKIQPDLLDLLNQFDVYAKPFPKSLSNEWVSQQVWPMLASSSFSVEDRLATYCEHIAQQIAKAVEMVRERIPEAHAPAKMLVTGGGAFHQYLISRISQWLRSLEIEVEVPDADLVKYKEALIMAFLAIRRWREESTALASVTGASRDSIGGALWIGHQS